MLYKSTARAPNIRQIHWWLWQSFLLCSWNLMKITCFDGCHAWRFSWCFSRSLKICECSITQYVHLFSISLILILTGSGLCIRLPLQLTHKSQRTACTVGGYHFCRDLWNSWPTVTLLVIIAGRLDLVIKTYLNQWYNLQWQTLCWAWTWTLLQPFHIQV